MGGRAAKRRQNVAGGVSRRARRFSPSSAPKRADMPRARPRALMARDSVGGGRAAQQELRPPMPAASAPPTDLASVEARFVHYAEPAPHPACSREAAEERSRRREPPGSAVPPSSAPKRAEDGQGAAAPAPPFSSPCSAWGRDHWTLLRPEKGRPGSGAASGACGWLTRSRTSWSSPSLTRGPSRVMKRGAGGPPGGSGGGLGVLAGQGGAEAPWAAREACGRWCLLGNDAGKAADRKGLEWRPLREVWRAASRCPVHRSADGSGGWSGV